MEDPRWPGPGGHMPITYHRGFWGSNMPDEQAHLRLADRHLAEAAERMARLRERIVERQLAGQCTAQAERLLDECETFMRLAVQHRQEILDAIAGGPPRQNQAPHWRAS
jgi:hypothetical protein